MSDFHDVNSELLDLIRPDFVLSPAISPRFDCLDLAAVLYEAQFKGMFRALTGQLPAPDVIQREVAACYPGLDFGFLDGQSLATIISA